MDRLKRIVLPAVLGLAVYFAVFGGEHTAFDLRSARADLEAETEALRAAHGEIDSLRARADSLESDPATLERVAREQYGMIRSGEILYRFAEPSDEGGEAEGEGADDQES